jgi:hypothetical protein
MSKCPRVKKWGIWWELKQERKLFLNIPCVKIWGIWWEWELGCNSLNCGNMWGICGEYGVIPKYCGNMWGICGEYGGNGN